MDGIIEQEWKIFIANQAYKIVSKEFTKHLTDRRAVHMLEVDWDGIIYANVDHTFMFTGIKYEGSLKFKEDLTMDEQDEWTAEWTPIYNELSKFINLLESELVK